MQFLASVKLHSDNNDKEDAIFIYYFLGRMESMKTYGLGVEDSLVSGLLLGSNNSSLAPTWASQYSHLMHIKRDPRSFHSCICYSK